MKNFIKLAILATASLCLCWFAGQQMKAARLTGQEQLTGEAGTNRTEGANRTEGTNQEESANRTEGTNQTAGANQPEGTNQTAGANQSEGTDQTAGTAGTWNLVDHMDTDSVSVEGRVESSDYPYGYNVGFIEDDEVGRAVLLTPDTAIGIEGTVSKDAFIGLGCFLHPWVAEGSDGALLTIAIKAEGKEHPAVYQVGTETVEQTLSLEPYAGQTVGIVLSVSNEEGKNVECDWVVLSRLCVSGVEITGE